MPKGRLKFIVAVVAAIYSGCDDGGSEGEAEGEVVDALCGDVPITGRCKDAETAEWCIVPSEGGEPHIGSQTCQEWQECQVVGGRARCAVQAGKCPPGASTCLSDTEASVCAPDGSLSSITCKRQCQDTPLGAICGADVNTALYDGTLVYETRVLQNVTTTADSTIEDAPMRGVWVISSHNGEPVDAAMSDEAGYFAIDIPEPFTADDRFVFILLGFSEAAADIAFAVMDPAGVQDGLVGDADFESTVGEGNIWSYALEAQDFKDFPAGSELRITEAEGAGAVQVFEDALLMFETARSDDYFGQEGLRLAIWVRPGVSWDCASCFFQWGARVKGWDFDAHIILGGGEDDPDYFDSPVTLHELGHWAMASHGGSPGEGGPHCRGVPARPGVAWSEGYATWHSSAVRGDPLYYDTGRSFFSWTDIAARTYSGGTAWPRPNAEDGLLQKVNETEISAMLWQLSETQSPRIVAEALMAPEMNESPFGRGYTRQVAISAGCDPKVTDTGVSAPMLADFLDALRCAGVEAAVIDDMTEPGEHYPYPSDTPICRKK